MMVGRNLKLVASIAAIALLASGCQKKPGGQVVAVVNGEEITDQDLNAELNGVSIPQGADGNQIRAQLLQQIINRKLLLQEAKSLGIDQSPAYLQQVRRAQDNLMLAFLTDKMGKNIAIPDASAVSRYIAANPTLFAARKRYALDQIIFARPADMSLIKELEATHSLDAIATVLKSHNLQFVRNKGQLDTGLVPPDMANRIAALPAGEPFMVPEKGTIVASVIVATEPAPTPDEQAKPAAITLLRKQAVDAALLKKLQAATAGAKIEYKTGYSAPKVGGAVAPALPAGDNVTP